nr:hypothetical protein [Tanacetum cinerariifolium]
MNILSKEDLDNLFEPMYQEYFEKRSSDTSINSAAQQVHNHKDSPLTSLIVVEEHEVPPIVTTFKEKISLIPLNKADESNQEDYVNFDGNIAFVPYDVLNFEEAESSTATLDLSNMHEFHQVQPSTHIWTKARPLKQRLDDDLQGTLIDQTTYRQMIKGLMHLTASRPDIAFATFNYARCKARPTVKYLKKVKQIFRYLRQSYNMSLGYPKDFGFKLIAYSDADHAGCKDDCKSASGGLQFLGEKLVCWSSKNQDCTAMSTTEAELVLSCRVIFDLGSLSLSFDFVFDSEILNLSP